MNKAEQYMKSKGGVVHVHFEQDGTYVREDDVYRLMLEYHAKQLRICAVMCQREQLIAFAKYSLENDLGNVNQSIIKDVDDFLAINCT